MFVASSAAAAASVIDVISQSERTRVVTRIFGTAGRIAEIAAARKVEQVASAIPKIGEPLERGGTALLWRVSTGLTAGSLAASLLPARRRKTSIVAGLLGIAGSLCLRLAVHFIGNASVRDPRASFQQQRLRQRLPPDAP